MPRCDIVIPVWNQLNLTKGCIDSILKNTAFPYRLILVDNASGMETAEYLNNFAGNNKEKAVLLKNNKNEGFVRAVNRGVLSADSEYVCVLNNDTLVSKNWLTEMVKVLERDPIIGIVNPSSNTLGQALPKNIDLDNYFENNIKQSGIFVETAAALGFCMLMRKKLFDEVGLFDEIYGMGNFEDTDFSLRTKEKGYKTVRSLASYVEHKENRSFNLLKTFKRDFDKNKKIFEAKWGKTERIMIVSKNIDPSFLKNILLKNAKKMSWVYVISSDSAAKKAYEKFSNISFYCYKRFFYTRSFFKILFKKKKSGIIYVDNAGLKNILQPFCACVILISGNLLQGLCQQA